MAKRGAVSRTVIAWQPAILRLTAFTQSPYGGSEDWWKKVVGTTAETEFTNAKTQERIKEGVFLNGKLTLNINPIRIDWRYAVTEEISQRGQQFNTLGAFSENNTRFRRLMDKWLSAPSIPPITRLAFGAVWLQPTDTLTKSTEILASCLPFLDLKDVPEFQYHINRPRKSRSGITDLEINRLSKWNLLKLRSVVSLLGSPSPLHPVAETYASYLEVDINTSADYKQALPNAQLPTLFAELIELGIEIAEKGDIK